MDWHGDEFLKDAEKKLSKNLARAAAFLAGRVKENLNRSQPYSRTVGSKGVWYRGLQPSLPGEMPKKVRGDLIRSIAWEMSEDGLQAYVGSGSDIALWLEVGTSRMAARPFLRQTLAQEQENIAKVLGGGE